MAALEGDLSEIRDSPRSTPMAGNLGISLASVRQTFAGAGTYVCTCIGLTQHGGGYHSTSKQVWSEVSVDNARQGRD